MNKVQKTKHSIIDKYLELNYEKFQNWKITPKTHKIKIQKIQIFM